MNQKQANGFTPTAAPLQRVGFFHFGRGQTEDPVAALRNALLAAAPQESDLRNSLIVLPEAFNLRGGYYSEDRRIDPSVAPCLRHLSIRLGIAFIAGLIESSCASSAYLIDGATAQLLSRKMQNDKSGNYQPSPLNHDQVIQHRGLSLAALLCMDAAFPPATPSQRRKRLLSQFQETQPASPVLCIPACMGTHSSLAIVEAWPREITTILSNSSVGQPSVMRIGETLIPIKPNENVESVIHLADLPTKTLQN